MSSAVEQTIKALVEFESLLERAKADAADAKRRASKDAADWAEGARTTALARAQEIAAQRVAKAREEAEAEAEKITKKGDVDLRAFEGSISRHRTEAAKLVAARLLGEGA